jgi:ABC-2 type transport system ATP-binding protein
MFLKISNLSKLYADGTKALTNVNLNIENGMFGLLGPNGAGKSSLMRTISTLQEPSEGSIFLDDLDVINNKEEMRKVLGYLPQDFGFYPKVSAVDMLHHFAILKGISNKNERKEICDALLHQTNLFEVRNRYIGDYSGGMRQRFGIAQALLGNPKVVIVDEPTAGLDPQERNRFHNLLSEVGENIIVILSTHIVEDVRNLCSKMAVMNLGQVMFEGKTTDSLELLKGKIFSSTIAKEELEEFRKQYNVISTKVSEGKIIAHVLNDFLPNSKFIAVDADLEDVYFSYINSNKN